MVKDNMERMMDKRTDNCGHKEAKKLEKPVVYALYEVQDALKETMDKTEETENGKP